MNFAVFASGFGGNLQAIINAVKRRQIRADLKLVLSDRADAYALKRAQKANVPTVFIDPKNFKDRESFDRVVVAILKREKIDFVVLAGFMRILSPYFIKTFPNKILNIHPSLLPAFKGARAIHDAFDYGVKATGVTVHFVDEAVDNGAIILQESILIKPTDTLKSLEKKIHSVEHKLYPKAIDLFARGKLRVRGRKEKN